MIDLHTHILPWMDDGAKDMEEAIAMARTAVRTGIHTLVAAPHTMTDVFTHPVDQVRDAVAELREVLEREGIDVRVLPGAEVFLCRDMLRHVREGRAGTLNHNGRYVLVEFPPLSVPSWYAEEIFSLTRNGITPVIAHPERNTHLQRNMRIVIDLVAAGALCQVTAMSVTGEFGEAARSSAEEMIRARLAHVIASDAHSAQDRPPVLVEAAERAAEILGSYQEARRMVDGAPAAILAGGDVTIPEPGKTKRKRWFW